MISYKTAGVDKEEGYRGVELIKKHIAKTQNTSVLNEVGGFASLYDIKGYNSPVLVSATDGVGTKLKIAIDANIFNTIGIDCVAMCVNDLLCHGAKPLIFLDYFATGKLQAETLERVVAGISEGCLQAECALVGGETAEMPGFYPNKDFDLAGFCVGIVEKQNVIDISQISAGDSLIGISSSGVHSNGFSLVRKIFPDITQKYDERPLFEELLKPTKIYHKALKRLFEKKQIKGAAHITGGGLYENVPRMIPDGLCASIYKKNIPVNTIFSFIEAQGVDNEEMFHTFNMGVGMVLVVSKKDETEIKKSINTLENEFHAFSLGTIITDSKNKICLE